MTNIEKSASPEAIAAIIESDHGDVFSCLGMHRAPHSDSLLVRAFAPGASAVDVIDAKSGKRVCALKLVHQDGLYEGDLGRRRKRFRYKLRLHYEQSEHEIYDPYSFPSVLYENDRYLFGEGTQERAYGWKGAHRMQVEGVEGTLFVVWAPNAKRVSVVGDFNHWDGRRHVMRQHPQNGVWEIFLPAVDQGALYKYEIRGPSGELLPLKADPYAFASNHPSDAASVVWPLDSYQWGDSDWMAKRKEHNVRGAPITIYEVHLGSWMRIPEEDNRYLTYRELAARLVPYVAEMGFTHIQLMPVSEYPFDGSWGYQPIGMFSPTCRFGTPDDFAWFVDCCHQADIGVLLDWVPGHFPTDEHGLGRFDGTFLYEHEDPRRGFHPDWNTLIYNYSRGEVVSYLLSNGHFWLDVYHIDGLRVDAVASMLYLDYSRKEGEWAPNVHGGRENLDAINMLQQVNQRLYQNFPDIMMVAEESTSWPGVSHPTSDGGLGFGYKWNMGWMNDTLHYMARDPIHRKHHHNEITFGLLYAFSENFVLPLSHDEVVHGKGSLLSRMPGDSWQQFANLRAYLGLMWSYPGKKLLFMGGEFGQRKEWNHDQSLDWHLLDDPTHAGLKSLVRDLNTLYRANPALHLLDCEGAGFEWIAADDDANSVFAFLRKGAEGTSPMVVVSNLTPTLHQHYRIGMPQPGFYAECLNTDSHIYGGSNAGNAGGVDAEPIPLNGHAWSIGIVLPPLATVVFQVAGGG